MSASVPLLDVRNFRPLTHVAWRPEGVCLLAGPNGAGKTTLLSALEFLRNMFLRGQYGALRWAGPSHLRRRGAPTDAPVFLSLERDDVRWEVELQPEGLGIHPYYGERLFRGDEVLLELKPFAATWTLGGESRAREDDCGLRMYWDKLEPTWLRGFVDLVRDIRVYNVYRMDGLRQAPEGNQSEHYLHPSGRNLWQVLRNWKSSPRKFNDQFAWVLEKTRSAFPNVLDDIEFPEGSGGVFQPVFYPTDSAGPDDSLPVQRAPDGLLTGLLHFTAVAGAAPGSILAFDELENQLHPHAIRVVLDAMREMAELRGLTVVLTSHSPVVMNGFKGREHQFFVLDPRTAGPVALDVLKDPDWLAHFALGDLYEREKIVPQRTELRR